MELISRERLKEVIEPMVGTFDDDGEFCWTRESILRAIDNAPTIEERKEGHWIKHFDEAFPGDSTIECSVCHEEQYTTIDDYFCPNCGAKMKGE